MLARKYLNLIVIVFVALGMPTYYKIKFLLLGQITLEQIFQWAGLTDVLFGTCLSTLIIFGHDFIVWRLRKHFGQKTEHLKRLAVQFFVTAAYSIAVVFLFTYLFFTFVFPWVVPNDTMFDFILLGLFIPIFVNGVKESLYFYGEWEAEALEKEQLEKANISAKYEILKNQVNPHFLFNCFNTLSELIMESREMAAKFLNQLSKVYRFVLENKDNEIVELADELKVLKSYLFLQKIRFGNNLHLAFSIGERAKNLSIPPLTLQLLLENALKHNVVSKKNPLKIDITVSRESTLIFRNSLQKNKSVKSTKMGLENIINRYKYLSDEPVNVTETATDFIVEIPLLQIKHA